MNHLLQCETNDSRALDLAIEVVGKAEDDQLTHMLVEYLMGEQDGMPKVCPHAASTHHHMHKLHMPPFLLFFSGITAYLLD